METKTVIIGAGVAGLTAAIELEKKGYKPVILEATDRVGGRVKTDFIDGYQLDHGFQVLLTAYPEVQRYLNLNDLNLHYFKPGARIFSNDAQTLFVDPLRQPSKLWAAVVSSAATLSDKWKIFRLSTSLKRKTLDQIFNAPSETTLNYLTQYGFSNQVITQFFKPFFSGIFLESELKTSSRLFEFIFKMFSEGYAAVPQNGMQEIPNHLLKQLRNSNIHYNCMVNSVENRKVSTTSGDFDFDQLIIATDPSGILPGRKKKALEYHSTVNLYFAIDQELGDEYIGLFSDSKLINNISFMNRVASKYAPEGTTLLSVSVVGLPKIANEKLTEGVREELMSYFNSSAEDIKFIKLFEIRYALPEVEQPGLDPKGDEMNIGENIFLAGDYLLGGSLNAAMRSGRIAAEKVMS